MQTVRLEFKEPNSRIEGSEVRSKLLSNVSDLYKRLERCRNNIQSKYPHLAPKRMDFHTELISGSEVPTSELLVSRASKLHNTEFPFRTDMIGKKAFGLVGPNADGYGQTHVTIAFFPGNIPSLSDLNNLCN